LLTIYIAWFNIVSQLLCFTCLSIPIINSRWPRPIGNSYLLPLYRLERLITDLRVMIPGAFRSHAFELLFYRSFSIYGSPMHLILFLRRIAYATDINDLNVQLYPLLLRKVITKITILTIFILSLMPYLYCIYFTISPAEHLVIHLLYYSIFTDITVPNLIPFFRVFIPLSVLLFYFKNEFGKIKY
jgi:hypothetical protein